jgi:sodium-dependent dicarboxylate transporter 2/3/5
MIALAMERWGLHKRIALKIITLFGGSPNSIVFGFMVSAGFLSMWISNTATAIMMLPIAIAIISRMENQFGKESTHNFTLALLLGVAYACTLGGMATLCLHTRRYGNTCRYSPQFSFCEDIKYHVP